MIRGEQIDHFDLIEIDDNAAACAARYVLDLVRLHCGLHRLEYGEKRHHEMIARLSGRC